MDDSHATTLTDWLHNTCHSHPPELTNDLDKPIPYVAPFDLHYADDVVGILPYHPQILHNAAHCLHPITIVGISPQQQPPTSSSMADTGASITGDALILVDLIDIHPIPLGIAVKSKDMASSPFSCNSSIVSSMDRS